MRTEILELRRDYEGALIRLVDACRPASPGQAHLDTALTARALLAMSNAAHAWFQPGGRHDREQIIAHHGALAARAVSPGP